MLDCLTLRDGWKSNFKKVNPKYYDKKLEGKKLKSIIKKLKV